MRTIDPVQSALTRRHLGVGHAGELDPPLAGPGDLLQCRVDVRQLTLPATVGGEPPSGARGRGEVGEEQVVVGDPVERSDAHHRVDRLVDRQRLGEVSHDEVHTIGVRGKAFLRALDHLAGSVQADQAYARPPLQQGLPVASRPAAGVEDGLVPVQPHPVQNPLAPPDVGEGEAVVRRRVPLVRHQSTTGVERSTIARRVPPSSIPNTPECAAPTGSSRTHRPRRRVRSAPGVTPAGRPPSTPRAGVRPPRGRRLRGARASPRPPGRAGGGRRARAPTSVIHASSTSGSRPSARSTSRALTLPDPSHTELSGASR